MPGSGKQPPQVQNQIKELLEAGFDPTTIHRRLKVGRSSIYRMKRCLQQHGTNYMPPELNKKNGRPKVLTPEQELEVRDWLREKGNRGRYLDDLVWLIHDRFGIVCSTTTMSKMKRKWLRVIALEEEGTPLDESTRQALLETHPDLPILHQQQNHVIPDAQMGAQQDDQFNNATEHSHIDDHSQHIPTSTDLDAQQQQAQQQMMLAQMVGEVQHLQDQQQQHVHHQYPMPHHTMNGHDPTVSL